LDGTGTESLGNGEDRSTRDVVGDIDDVEDTVGAIGSSGLGGASSGSCENLTGASAEGSSVGADSVNA
jgi:hypothetical protein